MDNIWWWEKNRLRQTSWILYRYWNSLYLRDNEVDLKVTKNQAPLAKRCYLLSYIDIIYKPCIVMDETTVQN